MSPTAPTLSSTALLEGAPTGGTLPVVRRILDAGVQPFDSGIPDLLRIATEVAFGSAAALSVTAADLPGTTILLSDPPAVDLHGSPDALTVPIRTGAAVGVTASLAILAAQELPLTGDRALIMELVADFVGVLVSRHIAACRSVARADDVVDRLGRHLTSATAVQDTTGNGIAVALGWLDALAHGQVPDDDRDRVMSSITRRLGLVQSTVNDLLDETAGLLLEELDLVPVDVAEAWQTTHRQPVTVRGLNQPFALSHRPSLTRFLAVAAPLLVPDVLADTEQVRVPMLDATRLTSEGRLFLRASGGTLLQRSGGVSASWAAAPTAS